MNYKNIINSIMAAGATGVTLLIGGWDSVMKILAILIILDYVTGIMKSAKEKKLDSSVGFNGLLKKAAIFVVVILAHQLDLTIPQEVPVFRTMVGYFYIANEGISITENIAILGVPLPSGLVGALKKLKEENNNVNNEADL